MKLTGIIQKMHDKVTQKMSESSFVDNVLIATVEDENGVKFDCIYCTIIRNAILFMCIGLISGIFLGALIW